MRSASIAKINGDFMTPFKFYLLTDTHYFLNSLGASGKAYDEYMKTEAFYLNESQEINRTIFKKLKEDETVDTIIIPGDLSKDGEYESHLSLQKDLQELKNSGKRIFVITAGHDYNDYGKCYKNDECFKIRGTEFSELYDIYYEFGYKNALALHKETLSYVAEVKENVRLLAINCDSTNELKGSVHEDLKAFIKEQAEKAKKDGAYIFAMCHYPILPSVPVFDFVGDARVKNWREIASFLADNGINLVLTGHMHIQSVNKFTSKNGNSIVDICTATTVGTPAKYRKINIDENGIMQVESIAVEDFNVELDGKTYEEFFDWRFEYAIKNKILGILNGGSGFVAFLKKTGKKILQNIKLGTLARLTFIRIDESLKGVKLLDFAGKIALVIFKGDQPFVKGTKEYDVINKFLNRIKFIIKKIEPKLSKDDEINLTDMVLNTIGNNKGFSDNNVTINLKTLNIK